MRRALPREWIALLVVGFALGAPACSDDDEGRRDAAIARDSGSRRDSGSPRDQAVGARDSGARRDGATAPPGHSELMKGVPHYPGKADPKANCVGCHGVNLRGGTAPSCYGCHNANDHALERGPNKVNHRTGPDSSCTSCHGPNNVGGLGPGCASCHSG